jgi:hypothetical protein
MDVDYTDSLVSVLTLGHERKLDEQTFQQYSGHHYGQGEEKDR